LEIVTRVRLDFTHVGLVEPGEHFTTRLLAHERRQLREGETVEVYGDTVEPIRVVVVKVHPKDPLVEFLVIDDRIPHRELAD
jgi:hypothetical protein